MAGTQATCKSSLPITFTCPRADFRRASFGADWGDYISFSHRLKERADAAGQDLLVIDTGDRVEGNGLYDASHPKGKYDMAIFDSQHVDLLCSGNHELYKRISVSFEYNTTVPHFKDHYIASNLDVIDPKTQQRQPLSHRFKKFTTKNQGIRVLALGFLFDFTNNADNVIVQKVEDTIKEGWFSDAMRDRDVDLFVVIGHVGLDALETKAIFRAIRESHWDTPIHFFGGHTHIRDYAKFDKKAFGLQSGRYLETIGFASIDGLRTAGKKPASKHLVRASPIPTFARRYIDNNLFSFHHHAGLNESNFATGHGLNVSARIRGARQKLNLDQLYGCAPKTFWTNRAEYPSESSVFTLLQDHIIPDKVTRSDRKDVPRIVITNTGAIRFDIFKGTFTTDTMYTVSPFTSQLRFVRDVPWKIAQLLPKILNQEVPQLWPTDLALEWQSRAPVKQDLNAHKTNLRTEAPYQNDQMPLEHWTGQKDDDLTPGYTTHDASGSDGDDTIHSPIRFYKVPNVIDSRLAFPPEEDDDKPESVDVVYNEFLERYILLALKFLGSDYNKDSTESYIHNKTMTALLGEWVKENWKCEQEVGDGEL